MSVDPSAPMESSFDSPGERPRTPSEIRLAVSSDAPQVAALIADTWSENFAWSVPPEDLERHLAGPLSVQSIRAEIERKDMRFLVSTDSTRSATATIDSGVEGGLAESPAPLDQPELVTGVVHLVYGPTEPCLTLAAPAELNRCYVLKSQQGTGLAAALIAHAEEQARQDGHRSLWLGVWEHNARAERFYAKMGFKRVGEHHFYVGNNERRDWVMEKPI